MEQLEFQDFFSEGKGYQSVSELTREIKQVLESRFDYVLLQGEISNFKHHSSGHMYFSLKDELAQISCVMWRSRNDMLFFTPQDGMKVTVQARVVVYEKRGNYQLDVWDMQPAGVGELQLAFDRLKNRLREEGLFAVEHKQPIPPFPQRIGLVTSPTGAAIQDLLQVLRRRNPAVEVILHPARVQGEGAAFEIAEAIDNFNEYGAVDVLIVGRGGGSLEDLWPFNEEMVARAIYRSKIPVISAVGHEVDFTISDFVADLRAPTPSAAAELAVPVREELQMLLSDWLNQMTQTFLQRLQQQRNKIEAIRNSYAFGQPVDLIHQHMQRLDELRKHLDIRMTHQMQRSRESLSALTQRLSLLEHESVLRRGYSLCYRLDDGTLVSDAANLQVDDGVRLEFYRGKAVAKVREIIGKSG